MLLHHSLVSGFSPITYFTSDAAAQRSLFYEFKVAFNRSYTSAEEPDRLAAFVENLARIDERNAEDTAVHGITKFCDLTPGEFKAYYTNYRPAPEIFANKVYAPRAGVAQDVDWTGKYTTPVKDQKQCGSCWAFSATEQIESDAMRELDVTYELSPQQIVSCDRTSLGCMGGDIAYGSVA
jgi:hypothetical protein